MRLHGDGAAAGSGHPPRTESALQHFLSHFGQEGAGLLGKETRAE